MRLLFDYQAFTMQQYGGISRLYSELIPYLQEEGIDCKIAIKQSNNRHLVESRIEETVEPETTSLLQKIIESHIPGRRTLGRIQKRIDVNRIDAIREIRKRGFDVFEPTYLDSYFIDYLKDKPFTMAIHDMIPERYPQYFSKDDFQIRMKKILCPMATRIHTPSQKTKDDLVEMLGIEAEKIDVVYRGTMMTASEGEEREIDEPYLLYVGNRWGYKNFIPFVRMYAAIAERERDLRLVCTGEPFNGEERRVITELGIADRVRTILVDDKRLANLYRNAVAFIYPSDYEGFGLPILEAWVQGCPVILNRASCFPEIGGDAALYFEIANGADELYEKVQYCMLSEKRKELKEKGERQLREYSWGAVAERMKEFYEKVVS